MADGLCSGSTGDAVIQISGKTVTAKEDCSNNKVECNVVVSADDNNVVVACKNVKLFYKSGESDHDDKLLFGVTKNNNNKINHSSAAKEGCFLIDKLCDTTATTTNTTTTTTLSEEDDCRNNKKRCADRYDSSESSDSGVAVLSCTDCSGSSTASSDITDPGSPFSTASSHSEDSASQPTKMPPTQTAHHPPWPWAAGESPPIKRLNSEKTGFPKRLKTVPDVVIEDDDEEDENNASTKQVQKVGESKKPPPPACLSSSIFHLNSSQIVVNNNSKNNSAQVLDSNKAPSSNLLQAKNKRVTTAKNVSGKTQGKITEYFKTQMKANGIKKDLSNATLKNPNLHKYFSWGLKQNISNSNNNSKMDNVCRSVRSANLVNKRDTSVKSRKLSSSVTVPRKILPAPSKVCDNSSLNSVSNISSFTPTVTLTTLAIPPNLTYLHTKTPKPPDNFIVQQFTTTLSDKINAAIPTIVSTSCINTTVIHPLPPPINNFNCFKLNATVVPIVKLNTLPSNTNSNTTTTAVALNTATATAVALNVEASVPTVLPAKPKIIESGIQTPPFVSDATTPSEPRSTSPDVVIVAETTVVECKSSSRIEECSPSSCLSSDSGVATKEQLEVDVDLMVVPSSEPQKSPILSQPKTIRFPAKQQESSEYKLSQNNHSADSTYCQWADCHLQFNTSGALLEHLQIKHVISQASQEQYECLWLGCKVHGRKSCSRSWLERHVLAHAGTKPFRCIFDGCGMRFNSQIALQRHVNGHFNADGSQNTSAKKSVDNGSVKHFRRNGKKLRFRRQPWSARMFDFFDNAIMEGLQHHLLALTNIRTRDLGESAVPGESVLFSSQILAKRVEPDGVQKVLLKWHPADVLPDEWIHANEYTVTKAVPIRTLEPMAINRLYSILFPHLNKQKDRHKQRRKPDKCT